MRPALRSVQDLLALIALTGAYVVTTAVPGASAAQAPLGVALALGGVGYALTCALWGARRPPGTELLLYSLALSVAATIAVALALDSAGIELSRNTLVRALVGVTIVGAAIALLRRPPAPGFGLRPRAIVATAALPVVVFAAALAALTRPIANDEVAGYTQLWSTRSSPGYVRIGVANAEQSSVAYTLRATSRGRTLLSRSLRLSPGQSWQREIAAPAKAEAAPVRVVLYREGNLDHPYRSVELAP